MKKKLFCYQCEKEYEVKIDEITYMQDHKKGSITFAEETYYFDEGCFFQTLNRLKKEENTKEKNYE
jgi:diadenosine tetraphosphatase ApaH/serine/threonine PP2A family protein phosphatase